MSYYPQIRRKPPQRVYAFSTAVSSRKRRDRRIVLMVLIAIIVVAGILVMLAWSAPSQMTQVAASENASNTSIVADVDGDWVAADGAEQQLTLTNGRYQFRITEQNQAYTEEGSLRQQGTSLTFEGDGSPSAITYIGYGNNQLMLQWNQQILILIRQSGNTQGA